MKQTNVLKVSSKSNVKSVAGSITKSFEDGKIVHIDTIGASAISQAVKAIALARGWLATKGYEVYCAPGFFTTHIDGEERTAIRFILKDF